MEEIASHSTGKGWKTKTPSACLWGPLTPAHLPPRPEARLYFTFREGCTCQQELLWESPGSKQRLDLEGHMLVTPSPVCPETFPKHSVRVCDGLGWVHCPVGWEEPCAWGVGSDQGGASTLGVNLALVLHVQCGGYCETHSPAKKVEGMSIFSRSAVHLVLCWAPKCIALIFRNTSKPVIYHSTSNMT